MFLSFSVEPYLMSCPLPESHKDKIPAIVSIVEDDCENIRNSLKVVFEPLKKNQRKEKFAVCSKGLDFPGEDISVKLVEWIEISRALGAAKIFLYQLDLHPNISKVLDYYTEAGVVDVRPITLPGHQPNMKGLQHLYMETRRRDIQLMQFETISLNDCLYRNIYRQVWTLVIVITLLCQI